MAMPPRPERPQPSLPVTTLSIEPTDPAPVSVDVDLSRLGDTEPSRAPAEPPSQPPSLNTLAAQIAELAAAQQVLIRRSTPPPEPPRSSIRVAAKNTAAATRIGMAVLGAFVVGAEFVADNYPHLRGPLRALFEVFIRVLGDDSGAATSLLLP